MEKKILDVGCGPGSKINATHVIDLNPAHIEGKENGIVWDLNKLPLPYENNMFDEVYCDNVLEHLDISAEEVLKEFYRILKHKGHLTVIVPNSMWWYDRVLYLFGKMTNDFILAHKKHFTKSYLALSLRNAGFKILSHHNKGFSFSPNFSGKDIRLVARKVE